MRDKRAKEAAASKKAWQSRVAALHGEEATLKREVDALAGTLLPNHTVHVFSRQTVTGP